MIKHERQLNEWTHQFDQLTSYENRLVRMAHLQLALTGKKKVNMDSHLLGVLYKMNKCRRGLGMKVLEVDGVDSFLPNRPVPESVLVALRSPESPDWLQRRLRVPPRTRREEGGFWNYEKRQVRQWKVRGDKRG